MSKFIRNLIIIVFGLGVAAAVFLTFQPEKNNEQNIEPNNYEQGGQEAYEQGGVTTQKYRNADMGLSFEYRVEPDGYTLIEQKEYNSLALMPTETYEFILGMSGGTEWPPGISITIHENTDNLFPATWTKTHTRESNYDPAWSWSLREVTVGGVPAVIYERDGLYAATVVVVSNNFKIYVIDGSYYSPEDEIRKDFEKFLESLLFF